MLLVACYSKAARQALRNVCNAHEGSVVRRFGRAALLRETEFGAFLALRLRADHGGDVQIERTEPLNEYADVPESVRKAAVAYADRDAPSTPYPAFAANTDHPDPAAMRNTDL
ncbi:MAG: hypothetical protein ABEJ68_02780 [Halobacteriaceae archaeon]